MQLKLELCELRPFRVGDEPDIVKQANNSKVALHLRERFPHPYTQKDGEAWVAYAAAQSPVINFAITLNDRVVGGIGLMPGADIHRISWETGYWLGEKFWGRGLATCALRGLIRHAFANFDVLNRLFANVDADHSASLRVLQKAGLRLEGKLIGCAQKGGRIVDQFVYAITRDEAEVQVK
jgi:RimJ/RimL family protein N-acetyltransferase